MVFLFEKDNKKTRSLLNGFFVLLSKILDYASKGITETKDLSSFFF
jgi:hypothetical protein